MLKVEGVAAGGAEAVVAVAAAVAAVDVVVDVVVDVGDSALLKD